MRYVIFMFLVLPYGLNSQCDIDRHNTSANSGWKSCSVSPNPNIARGDGHWILYDFSFDYLLEQVHLWNNNHPETLTEGVKDITIDVSDNGEEWTEVATMIVPMASGSSKYLGVDGPVLNSRARFMLITAHTNHGGSCTSLGEMRVSVADEILCQNYVALTGDLGNKKYYATDYINSDGIVNNNSIVHFQAGNEVNITIGFETKDNTDFQIEIKPCNN